MGESSQAVEQSNNITPPRLGNVISIGVDSTSRGYDLTALLFNKVPANRSATQDWFYLSIQCESNDVYYATDSAAVGVNGISDTAGTAAGVAPALDNTSSPVATCQCAHLVAGLPEVPIRIDRAFDKTLILKCASGKTATFRMWASSNSTPGVT